ncbi:MAG: dimethylsulfonioproprionate lyase family protein [Dongiaceae bacterium]
MIAALDRLLAALTRRLEAAGPAAAPEAGPDLAWFAAALAAVPRPAVLAPRPADGLPLPACRFWDMALLAALDGPAADLAAPLAALGPALAWAQNPNYVRRPPSPAFLDDYGYAVIAGPAAGPPSLVTDEAMAFGVLLLGPGTLYPAHDHPAIELYLTLDAAGAWQRDAGPWRRPPAGSLIHHPSGMIHAMRAGEGPLLALYLWRGALATHARLLEG